MTEAERAEYAGMKAELVARRVQRGVDEVAYEAAMLGCCIGMLGHLVHHDDWGEAAALVLFAVVLSYKLYLARRAVLLAAPKEPTP